jgi:hypothetical protein
MCVERTVGGMLLKAQAHLVVGVPQILTHTETMTHLKTTVRARIDPGPHLRQWVCQPRQGALPESL